MRFDRFILPELCTFGQAYFYSSFFFTLDGYDKESKFQYAPLLLLFGILSLLVRNQKLRILYNALFVIPWLFIFISILSGSIGYIMLLFIALILTAESIAIIVMLLSLIVKAVKKS